MKWDKQGLVFSVEKNYDWMVSHASIPIVWNVSPEVLRIYFGTRDAKGRSLPAYIEVDAENPTRVVYVHDRPLLSLGELGTFDDCGVMPSWLVQNGGVTYLYYIGWNTRGTVPYHLSIGLAISEDNGKHFRRYSAGPICDRGIDEPYFNTTPCVLIEGAKWRMWYASGTEWAVVNGRPEPRYDVKYAESSDGIRWIRNGQKCIDYDTFAKAIARPCVFLHDGMYRMIYSYRTTLNYRTDRNNSYRLGYAESPDGLTWVRKDEEVGIEPSVAGWDSEMIEYCWVHKARNRTYLFYSGNGFGKSGFGVAILAG